MKKIRPYPLFLLSAVATSVMTLFSHLLSRRMKQNFNEPKLLAGILTAPLFGGNLVAAKMLAWLLHYQMGFTWALVYRVLLANSKKEANAKTGFTFGIICGAGSVLGWIIMFRIQKRKPPGNPSLYYQQLFVAHLIFSMLLGSIMSSPDRRSKGIDKAPRMIL